MLRRRRSSNESRFRRFSFQLCHRNLVNVPASHLCMQRDASGQRRGGRQRQRDRRGLRNREVHHSGAHHIFLLKSAVVVSLARATLVIRDDATHAAARQRRVTAVHLGTEDDAFARKEWPHALARSG